MASKHQIDALAAQVNTQKARAEAAYQELEKRPSLDEFLAEKDWAEKCEARAEAAERRADLTERLLENANQGWKDDAAKLARVREKCENELKTDNRPSRRWAWHEILAILNEEDE